MVLECKGQYCPSFSLPFGKKAGLKLPLVPASLAIFEIHIYRHGDLVVRVFAWQSEDLDSTLIESDQNT